VKELNVGVAVGLLLGIKDLPDCGGRSQVGHSKRIAIGEVDERWRNRRSVSDGVEIGRVQVLPLPPNSVEI
jgi:hypothetical protein